MKSSHNDEVTHFKCPAHVTRELRLAGGENPFGEPMFRAVWGYDRIVSIHGEWQEFEQVRVPDFQPSGIVADQNGREGVLMLAQPGATRLVTRLKRSVIETRQLPKYLPGNCWHLEMWRPAEEYGSPETWGKLGQEVIGAMTIDTSGPYPECGEYELCYPLTTDGTSHGKPIPLVTDVVFDIVQMIRAGKERFTFQQRKAAIEQREALKEQGFVDQTIAMLKDGLRPFCGETFITVPGNAR